MSRRFDPNKLHLKWKVFAFLLGFCALLLVVLWLFQTVFLNDMYQFIRKQELAQVIATVEKEIENPDLQAVLLRIQDENDVMVTPTMDFVPPQRPMAEQPQGGRGNPPIAAITETREFTLKSGRVISLTFYAMVAPVNSTISTLRMQLYIITGVMLVFSVFLAIVIAKRVSRPIEDINRSALTLAKGDYSTRFEGKGFYEIVSLSETLNTAAVELGRVEGLRRELLANVSHDLRTPLALISSYAEMMHDFSDEITPEQTQVIMDETRRLTTIVNDVLDISKLENEMERLDRSYFNLTRSILRTTERMKELLKNEGFEIVFSYNNEIIVNADEKKIDRAFYNLLINAVNYSGENRSISVAQAISGNHVRISVTDSGEGVAEEEMPFIWDRYYKSGKPYRRAISGSGLGLSIVKKIIEKHGGSYGVASEVGRGSTFWFEIERRGSESAAAGDER